MFKNMTVGKKIALGFSVVLVLLVVVGCISYTALNTASDGFAEYRGLARDTNLAGRLQANMLMVRMNVKDFLITGSDEDKQQYREYYNKMRTFLEEAQEEIQQPERAAMIDAIDKDVKDYEVGFTQVVEHRVRRDTMVNTVLNVKGPQMEQALTQIMASAEKDKDMAAAYGAGQGLRSLLLGRLYMAKFLDTNDPQAAARVDKEFGELQNHLDQLDKGLENAERRSLLTTMQADRKAYQTTFASLVKLIGERNAIITGTLDRIGPKVAKQTEDVKLSVKADQDELGPQLQAANSMAVMLVTVVGIIAIVLGATLAFVISRGIVTTLKRIIEGLRSSAEQVSAASSQVSSSSQQLAQGSSEQASSLEETSASLEEMASMAKQNAANAKQANSLSDEAVQSTEQGAEAMGRMSDAIGKIKQSSDETARIIKVIDEIAFQTNLLALNAAVEAARAGDAGKGFAVVAEEVRNLAQRSAEAAKNTADLIDGAQQNAENGVKVTEDVTTILGEVTGGVRKVTDLLGEVSGASDEQSRGVEQINVAVGQMDQVTQQVAANAEESAAASEELSAQAVQLNDMVVELAAIVGGSRTAQAGNAPAAPMTAPPRRAPAPQQVSTATLSPTASRAAAPESVIPLDSKEEDAVLSEF